MVMRPRSVRSPKARRAGTAVVTALLLATAACASTATTKPVSTSHPETVAIATSSSPFVPEMMARASGTVVYVLGTVACPTGVCSRLLRSSDDGSSFEPVSLPVPGFVVGAVQELRFANPTDGYLLYGQPVNDVLYVTDDSAHSWRAVNFGSKLSVLSIATTPQLAYATVSKPSAGRWGSYRLARSVAGSSNWTVVSVARAERYSETLVGAAVGERVWLVAGNGTGDVTLSLSVNEGTSFTDIWNGAGLISCGPFATSDTVVWLDCSGGTMADWFRSTDGGRHFRFISALRPYHTAPFDPVGNTVVFTCLPAGSGADVYRSTNGGETFEVRGKVPVKDVQGADVSFANRQQGLVLVSPLVAPPNELFRTNDGGVTWIRVRV